MHLKEGAIRLQPPFAFGHERLSEIVEAIEVAELFAKHPSSSNR